MVLNLFLQNIILVLLLTKYKGLIEILVTFCNDLHVISRKPRKPRNTREFFERYGTKYSRMDQVKFVEDSP